MIKIVTIEVSAANSTRDKGFLLEDKLIMIGGKGINSHAAYELANEIEQLNKENKSLKREICETDTDNDQWNCDCAAYAKERGWNDILDEEEEREDQ